MGDLAASGGYYIAASADEIWAHPSTITGSIGIFGAIPTFQNTLKKVGVSVDGVGTTNLSGQLRVDRPLGEDAKVLLQTLIERGLRTVPRACRPRAARRRVTKCTRSRRAACGSAPTPRTMDWSITLGLFDQAVTSAAKRAELGDDYEVEMHRAVSSPCSKQLALQRQGLVREQRHRRGRRPRASPAGRARVRAPDARAAAMDAHERARPPLRVLLLRGSMKRGQTRGQSPALRI